MEYRYQYVLCEPKYILKTSGDRKRRLRSNFKDKHQQIILGNELHTRVFSFTQGYKQIFHSLKFCTVATFEVPDM